VQDLVLAPFLFLMEFDCYFGAERLGIFGSKIPAVRYIFFP
jgi:hypothetical protein